MDPATASGELGIMLDPAYVASPTSTVASLWQLLADSSYWYDLEVSGEELVLGLGLSIVIGVVGGIVTGWYRTLRSAFQPIVNGIRIYMGLKGTAGGGGEQADHGVQRQAGRRLRDRDRGQVGALGSVGAQDDTV